MNSKFIKLDADNENALKMYKDFYYTYMSENPKKPAINKDTFEDKIKRLLSNEKFEIYLAEIDNTIVAEFKSELKPLLDDSYIDLNLTYLKDADENLVSSFVEDNIKIQIKRKQKLVFVSKKNFVYELLTKLDFKRRNSFVNFELALNVIDKSYLENTIQSIDLSDYNLKDGFYGNPTFNIVEKIAPFKTELVKDMICEDKHMTVVISAKRKMKQIEAAKKELKINLFYLLFKENELMGMSEIMLNQNKPKIVMQYMTGVKKELTSNGLATFMKAKLYTYLLNEFPTIEKIYTDCFSANAPMIKINKRLGFQLYKTTHELVYA